METPMPYFDPNDPDAENTMRSFFSPHMVDHEIRQAIQFCWMSLPPDRKNVDEVETQIRRIVDRALRDFREDSDQFLGGT